MPEELQTCIKKGADTTLMVWADLDHDMDDGDQLRQKFYKEARQNGIADNDFDRVVFVFAKDRLENWIEFLLTGSTDEAQEGRREKDGKAVSAAAKKLAQICSGQLTLVSRTNESLIAARDNQLVRLAVLGLMAKKHRRQIAYAAPSSTPECGPNTVTPLCSTAMLLWLLRLLRLDTSLL